MIVIVQQNQSILDIATQYTGSSENAIAILLANQKANTSVFVGENIIIPESLFSVKSNTFYRSNGMDIGCLAIGLDPEDWQPEIDDDEMAVSINEILYQTVLANTTLDIPILNSLDNRVAISLSNVDVRVKDTELNLYYQSDYVGTEYIPAYQDANLDISDIAIPTPPISGPSPVYQGGDVNIRVNHQYHRSVESPGAVNIPLLNSEGTPIVYTKAGQKVMLEDFAINIYVNETFIQTIDLPISSQKTLNIQ